MTPTLRGRWHTRVWLWLVVGIPATIVFSLLTLSVHEGRGFFLLPIALVGVLVAGLGLDIAYHQVQQFRWDHDWPTWLQVLAALAEFVVAGVLLLPLWKAAGGTALALYPFHFLAVWLPSFLMLQGPIHVLLPHWRFTGGEVWPRKPR